MQGTIAFKDPVNLRINGSFEGKLDTKGSLTIGENAKVKAMINGDRIIVAGKVTGDIHAAQSLSVIAPAVIQGNVTTPRLSVTEGAVLDGQLTMASVRGASDFEGDVMMTLKDVSQYLEVESKIVEEWAGRNKIPARYEENGWVFSKAAVDRWIQEENIKV
jgi:cytoskeletal protein CcmA (bactofilin family)